jgi:hypothetical protein
LCCVFLGEVGRECVRPWPGWIAPGRPTLLGCCSNSATRSFKPPVSLAFGRLGDIALPCASAVLVDSVGVSHRYNTTTTPLDLGLIRALTHARVPPKHNTMRCAERTACDRGPRAAVLRGDQDVPDGVRVAPLERKGHTFEVRHRLTLQLGSALRTSSGQRVASMRS